VLVGNTSEKNLICNVSFNVSSKIIYIKIGLLTMTNKSMDPQVKTADAGPVTISPKKLYKSLLKKYPDVLDVPQASEALGISSKTMYRLLNTGVIQSLKIGRCYRIPKIFLLRYLHIIDY